MRDYARWIRTRNYAGTNLRSGTINGGRSAELFEDFVVRDGFANHEQLNLRLSVWRKLYPESRAKSACDGMVLQKASQRKKGLEGWAGG
jgi:hypothetical protein